MPLKWIMGICALALSLYAGYQSILISQVGVSQQIPQLTGDGGGGILFATLLLVAAFICVFRIRIAAFIFLLGMVESGFVSLLFSDPTIFVWSLLTAICAILCFFMKQDKSHRIQYKNVQRHPVKNN